jgi:phosphoglycolate phosphatase
MKLIDRYDSYLFDLDGTLTDPSEGITRSLQYALSQMKIVENNRDVLIAFIGPPLKESFMDRYGLSEPEADKAVQYYREYFSEKGLFENVKFDDMERILARLAMREKKLFVATSKPAVFAERIAHWFGLSRYFIEIAGSELDGRRTRKEDVIRYIFSRHDVEKKRTIMIGDRACDVLGARHNGIAAISVGFGFGSREELDTAGADFFVKTADELELLIFGD